MDLFEECEVKSIPENIPYNQYLDAVEVWIKKPHTLNRRLIGAKLSQPAFVDVEIDQYCIFNIFTEIYALKSDLSIEYITKKLIEIVGKLNEKQGSKTTDKYKVEIRIRDLVPKQLDRFHTSRELIIRCGNFTGFFPLCHIGEDQLYKHEDNTLAYISSYDNERLTFWTSKVQEEPPCQALGVSHQWLRDLLFPKIYNWMHTKDLNTDASSLKLLPVDEYSSKYQYLKVKYGPRLVESWTEATDPRKFVYEDIAIAAYILLLWEEDNESKPNRPIQKFVDLGCGNGLLVHLLTSEGHKGVGLDIRKRKIWDSFGPETLLKEESITPSDETLFPEYDWLIGNHSDELTPWIPVMAARSSYNCNYFVLPCCHWDFASRFSDKKRNSSQYRTYLDYIEEVGRVSGFDVEEDTLRIPSTKRVCFIGRRRTYTSDEEHIIDKNRSEFILRRSARNRSNLITNVTESFQDVALSNDKMKESDGAPNTRGTGKWADSFTARKPEEAMTSNCVSVAEDIKATIVSLVFERLLSLDDARTVVLEGRGEYNMGGSLPLGDVVEMVDEQMLKKLKCECGGLQTLLRNHHQIFQVQGGAVQLRDWREPNAHQLYQQAKKKRKGSTYQPGGGAGRIKTRLCYFHEHHPQGCVLPAENCGFAHGQTELR